MTDRGSAFVISVLLGAAALLAGASGAPAQVAFQPEALDTRLAPPIELLDAVGFSNQFKTFGRQSGGVSTTLTGASLTTALVSGLASAIEIQARRSVERAAVTRMRDHLCAEPDIRALVPSTCAILPPAGESLGSVSWSLLRSSFQYDLDRMPGMLLAARTPERYVHWRPLARFGADALVLLQQGHPFDQVAKGARTYFLEQTGGPDTEAVRSALVAWSVAVEIASLGGASPGWGAGAVERLEQELQRLGLNPQYDDRQEIEAAFLRLRTSLDEVNRASKAFRAVHADSVEARIRLYESYMRTALAVGRAVPSFTPTLAGADSVLTRFPAFQAAVEELPPIIAASLRGQYAASLTRALVVLRDLDPTWTAGGVARYLGLAVDLAQADSTQAVEAAIASAIVSGGVTEKRQAGGLTVGSYLGYQGSWESTNADSCSSCFAHGIFAPVGIEAHISLARGGGSLGLLLAPLDLGAVFSRRSDASPATGGGEVVEEPEIGLWQVLAPGAYLTLSFPNDIPLALGVGISAAPNLRTLEAEDGTRTSLTARRIILFTAIDVPLFRIR